jgi:hypothetical protein
VCVFLFFIYIFFNDFFFFYTFCTHFKITGFPLSSLYAPTDKFTLFVAGSFLNASATPVFVFFFFRCCFFFFFILPSTGSGGFKGTPVQIEKDLFNTF